MPTPTAYPDPEVVLKVSVKILTPTKPIKSMVNKAVDRMMVFFVFMNICLVKIVHIHDSNNAL